ncbi:Porphobilinogen synthase [Oleidesulfovibrio alaskensis G20]|uniref:Delta-aminolevulinic acid dehydratase n=1 Tax=Oleidesulfovibrio alaskensis (strain ATCC BAA-1058 / DSM 17464 / G20) TaxID=207559 RepID=Q30Y74_OLEA2|nr:porphobilinogen synthase [Oleidesulfovibrio alaskensis]ABB39372.1 Porphobilinogen synthase [Oleidesulfovibrio alaskensis G20]MBG0773806.1 porphobilinogen synthase [Oleidesulfovibrio alaskensis]
MSDFFRGRRLRRNAPMRELVREHDISARHLVMPYFVVETDDAGFRKPITSMPGIFQLSLAELEKDVAEAVALGMRSVILFGIPAAKDYKGSEAYNHDGIVQKAIRRLKERFPDLLVITDVCLCEYTSHGHCGLLRQGDTTGEVHNDPTLTLLAKAAVSHAEAGADIVAPSDMMDGRVLAIREALDANGFSHIPVMSYAVKYASAFYGPFREAAESTPQHGDRKTYQMDPANSREAMREAAADVAEGADFLIVKPAGPYMDIIRMVRDSFDLPVAAYQVSGEYSMIKAAAINDWIDGDKVAMESLTGLRRAGADIIISYLTVEMLRKKLVSA